MRELNDVFVYTIDDLGSVVSAGKVSRSQALEKAEALVADCVKTFSQWKKSRETVPAVLKLRERAKALSETELARAKKSLKKGVDPELVLEHLARSLTKNSRTIQRCTLKTPQKTKTKSSRLLNSSVLGTRRCSEDLYTSRKV